jgi:16S rRNA (uracil1498-N3)-methyltransferase
MNSTSKPRLRLYVPDDLGPDRSFALDQGQSHYLGSVMRADLGEAVSVFNGRDGQWLCRIEKIGKREVILSVDSQTRLQHAEPDVWLLAAPIKRDRIDLVAEKAGELGASVFWPVMTQHTVMNRVNSERLAAHLKEAAEQCERLTVPILKEPVSLEKALHDWDSNRVLIYLDETGGQPLFQLIADLPKNAPLAVLVGPEGGFSRQERDWLRTLPMVRPVTLGERILRAETAAIAALAVIGAVRG